MKYLTIIALAIFSLTNCSESRAQQKGIIEHVDAARFKQLVDAGKGIVLDVRTPDEVAEGYIKGATFIDFEEDGFEKRISQLDKSKEVYVYCAGGGRSSIAATKMQKMGFVKVYNLEDGFEDWRNKNFPVAKP